MDRLADPNLEYQDAMMNSKNGLTLKKMKSTSCPYEKNYVYW